MTPTRLLTTPALLALALVATVQCSPAPDEDDPTSLQVIEGTQGLHGYVGYTTPTRPPEYGAGVGFYTAVWPLVEEPLAGFQIGLPGNWITPDNADNDDTPLCPEGTIARTWEPRGPTWSSVFQTIEGGLGYWRGNRFHYDSPKFSMNGVPDCYNSEVASPGWPFFYRNAALPDDELGIAQLSNRLVIPPDGIPFEGSLEGTFLGYAHMALPLTEARTERVPTGDQSWTLFLNAENFKGPVAFYVPDLWSRLSTTYEFIEGRGLDSRPGIMATGGAMEINSVPSFEMAQGDGTRFVKIPQLHFPLDGDGRSPLVQEVAYYSRDLLFNCVLRWREGGEPCSPTFDERHAWKPELSPRELSLNQGGGLNQGGAALSGLEAIFEPVVLPTNAFGLQWQENPITERGAFPQYFRVEEGQRVPVAPSEVPAELREREFTPAGDELEYVNWRNGQQVVPGEFIVPKKEPYVSPSTGAWADPGPVAGPFTATLRDGSTITYHWYRFVDQPSLQQFDWTAEERAALQRLVEEIHTHWSIDQEYMAPPGLGTLVTIDPALVLDPPDGLEVGYVPIVTRQEG
jgi:hypothetical protein